MSSERRARSLGGRGYHQSLYKAALAVRERDLGDADVLEGSTRHIAPARRADLLLALHFAHKLPHKRLADLRVMNID